MRGRGEREREKKMGAWGEERKANERSLRTGRRGEEKGAYAPRSGNKKARTGRRKK